jgi:tungstate transport system ATP-binding protein
MGGFLYARAEKLSGGETKRIALARALALRPAVLLCDEPTANVDGEHQEVILNILERANSDEHISIVFSTHDLEQAERLADTLVTLKDGQLSRLSRVNVWHATIVDGQVAVIAGRGQSEVKIVLPQPVSLRHGTTRRRLFLDPERLVLLPPEAEAGEGQLLPATVVQLVADQGRVRVTVDIGIPVDVYLTTNIYAQRPPCIGEPFLLQIAAASLAIE